MIEILISSLLLYAGCFGFYQWNVKRSTIGWLKQNSVFRGVILALSWVLVVGALSLFARVAGWERAVPLWLGGLTLAGAVNLLSASLYARPHIVLGAISVVGSAIGGVVLVSGSAA
ncbi:MAG: hypothetical protein AAFR28_00090 [Pseudomonadota bacterium]